MASILHRIHVLLFIIYTTRYIKKAIKIEIKHSYFNSFPILSIYFDVFHYNQPRSRHL